jgi:hypothetical protein
MFIGIVIVITTQMSPILVLYPDGRHEWTKRFVFKKHEYRLTSTGIIEERNVETNWYDYGSPIRFKNGIVLCTSWDEVDSVWRQARSRLLANLVVLDEHPRMNDLIWVRVKDFLGVTARYDYEVHDYEPTHE